MGDNVHYLTGEVMPPEKHKPLEDQASFDNTRLKRLLEIKRAEVQRLFRLAVTQQRTIDENRRLLDLRAREIALLQKNDEDWQEAFRLMNQARDDRAVNRGGWVLFGVGLTLVVKAILNVFFFG